MKKSNPSTPIPTPRCSDIGVKLALTTAGVGYRVGSGVESYVTYTVSVTEETDALSRTVTPV